MKKLIVRTQVICLIVMSACVYGGELYIFQPFVGYTFSHQTTNLDDDTSVMVADETRFATDGFVFGFRAGFIVAPSFYLSADVKRASTSGEGQGVYYNDTTIKRELTETSLFGSLVYKNSTVPLWFWVGMGVWGKYEDKGEFDTGAEQKMKAGKSYKVGGGLFFTQNTTFNLEFESIDTKRDRESATKPQMQAEKAGDGKIYNAVFSIGLCL